MATSIPRGNNQRSNRNRVDQNGVDQNKLDQNAPIQNGRQQSRNGSQKRRGPHAGLPSPIPSASDGLHASDGLQLCYPGKREECEILNTPPAQLSVLWASEEQAKIAPVNRLYMEDNLPVLASLLDDASVRGQVRLIYIDPPYATGGVFQSRSQQDAYDDSLLGPRYVEFLRERLILLREVLADDGSIYVHLDKNMAFAIKIILDEIFGPKNFRSWITRKKCNPKNYTTRSYGNVTDYLLFYTKSDSYVWNRAVEEWTEARALKEYSCVDENGRRYKKVPIHAPGVRNGETGKVWRGMSPPPGKHWQYLPSTLDEMDARGDIYWSPTGNPRRKVYFDQSNGVPVQDIWMELRDAHNQNIPITGFPTEKNPALLKRIIEASSNPGDLVLDSFCGSGTTLAVASQLERRWIGIDNSALAIATTLRRFAQGLLPMGDFVSQRNGGQTLGNQASGAVPEQMSLLATLPESMVREVTFSDPPQSHHIADNFALFTDGQSALDVGNGVPPTLSELAEFIAPLDVNICIRPLS